MVRFDNHHLLFERVPWESRKESAYLRNTPELQVHINRRHHEEIHRLLSPVPLLGVHALQQTVSRFNPVEYDILATIENLVRSIEQTTKHPKARDIEKRLSLLAIEALLEQRDVIKWVV